MNAAVVTIFALTMMQSRGAGRESLAQRVPGSPSRAAFAWIGVVERWVGREEPESRKDGRVFRDYRGPSTLARKDGAPALRMTGFIFWRRAKGEKRIAISFMADS